jgi:hypothetical protein
MRRMTHICPGEGDEGWRESGMAARERVGVRGGGSASGWKEKEGRRCCLQGLIRCADWGLVREPLEAYLAPVLTVLDGQA